MVEVLSATLTGANPSREASSFFDADGPPPGVGHFAIAIDPDGAAAGFAGRLEQLASAIEGEAGARLPGAGRLARRAAAAREGVAVTAATAGMLRRLGQG
jgi:(2R)-3-sulfolactate dehydrogenase (NADP+)